jgi:hypothetical protein
VVRVIDNGRQDRPFGVVVRTLLGDREIDEVWLAPHSGSGRPQGENTDWEGYSPEVLEALD